MPGPKGARGPIPIARAIRAWLSLGPHVGTVRRVVAPLLGAALVLAMVAPAALADRSYHTDRVEVTVTAAGAQADYPALRHGQVLNIHASGPTVFALEQYMLAGAKPDTDYAVVLSLQAGDCAGPFAMLFPNGLVLTTNSNGDAHGQVRFTPDEVGSFGLHNTDWGITWTFVAANNIVAYASACSNVHID